MRINKVCGLHYKNLSMVYAEVLEGLGGSAVLDLFESLQKIIIIVKAHDSRGFFYGLAL